MANTPIKRSRFLAELSRDHHSGLLFCWKIKEGMKRNIAPHRVKKYINFFWDQHLKAHFQEEERLLFNHLNDTLCRQGKSEHLMLQERLKRLNYYEKESKEDYVLFAELLIKHIRFEERTLFPHLETALPETILQYIGEFLASQHSAQFTDTYPDEFWVKTTVE